MPVRYAGNDNRITYGKTPIKSIMQGEKAIYGEDIFAKQPLFTYSETQYSVTITGLTDLGKTRENIIIPSQHNGKVVTSIGQSAFSGCTSLASIAIPNGVTSIGNNAFSGCDSLEAVHITDIGKWAAINFSGYYTNPLYYAKNLYLNGELVTDLVIPEGVKSIGSSAFSNCTPLTSAIIPDSVTRIGDRAFEGCTSLTSITIGNGVTNIRNFAFNSCTSLESITVEEGNAVYHSSGNCVIETATKTLIAGCNGSVIPDDGSVTSIGDYAFHDRTSLTSITIPNSVTGIGSYAFEDCTSLTSVTIPDSVTSIESGAFKGCTSLASVGIGNGVTSIGSTAFWYCTSLTSVTIPNSVTSIESQAFYNCTSLTSITIGNGVTNIGAWAFTYCTSLTSVTFTGTITQWNAITKGSGWNSGCPFTQVHCSDGTVSV